MTDSPLSFFNLFTRAIDFCWNITNIEIGGISPFKVALVTFLISCAFRFFINPLIGTDAGISSQIEQEVINHRNRTSNKSSSSSSSFDELKGYISKKHNKK